MDLSSYVSFGDIEFDGPPTKAEQRAQKSSVKIANAVKRMHFHESVDADEVSRLHSHTHDNDAVGHVHDDARGAWGPSMAKHPGFSPQKQAELAALFSRPKGPLVEWQVRLICGHRRTLIAHASYKDLRSATSSSSCPQCGLSPALIVASAPGHLIPDEGAQRISMVSDRRETTGSESASSEPIPPKGDGVPPGWHRIEHPAR